MTTVHFAGRRWKVKDSGGVAVGPGGNYFAAGSVDADANGLHLRVQVVNGRLECGEVVLQDQLSYGRYRFTVDTDLTRLASALTLGMFLWSDDDAFANREVDIEAAQRGPAGVDGHDMQFVVQPFTAPRHLLRFSLGSYKGPSVHEFEWSPSRVTFRSSNGDTLVGQFEVTHGVPPPGGDPRVRINLWRNTPAAGTSDGIAHVVVTDFAFEPVP